MKVLIVEDEALIRKSLIKLLSKKGAIVSAASSGREAIEKIKQESFDRIVCDLMLQDTTGFDVIEDAKRILGAELIPRLFVIITAYNSEQVLSKAREYSCPVINKPFENLDEALNIMLNLSGNE